jgi:shikimate dehydrogenase/3-dehydroquinate dehydratase type I
VICVTGAERSVAQLAERFAAVDERIAGSAVSHAEVLHEVRLDRLDTIDDELFALLASRHDLLVCCRAARQGGAFDGDEAARGAVLRRAAADGARYVDLEADVPDDWLQAIGRERVVLSWHDFATLPSDLAAQARQMAKRAPAVVKLAVQVDDAAELAELQRVAGMIEGEQVLIGMGAAGVLSRSHYKAFGSSWSYVAASAETSTAAGQLDLEQALAMGLPASASEPVCGLVGGPQIAHSPGPRVYNRLFRQLGVGSSYVPLVSATLAPLADWLATLGVLGLSVTMPHKQAAFAMCDRDERAETLGAVNSLRLRDDRWQGRNSDVTGVREPLERLGHSLAGKSALILGAGGAARAARRACLELGMTVRVSARRHDQARALDGDAMPWSARANVDCSVLINATPLCDEQSPWPDDAAVDAEVVFDLALGAGRSQLLRRAAACGALTLGPTHMWAAQGAEQMRFFLGRELRSEALEELLA